MSEGEISQEEAIFYTQMAIIMSMDLDILDEITEDTGNDAEMLRKCIKSVIKKRDRAIADAVHRQMRYEAMGAIDDLMKRQNK